jgi:hypothetical protein
VTLATGERGTSVSALFSVSCVVRVAAFRLPKKKKEINITHEMTEAGLEPAPYIA